MQRRLLLISWEKERGGGSGRGDRLEEAGGRQTLLPCTHPPSVTRLNMLRCYEKNARARKRSSCIMCLPSPWNLALCNTLSDHEFQIWGAQGGSSAAKQERSQQYSQMLWSFWGETLVLSSTVSSSAPQFYSVILVDDKHSEYSYCYLIMAKQSQEQHQELHGSSELMTKIRLRLVRGASKRSKGTAGISRKCWLCLKNNAALQTRSVGEWCQREITCCAVVFLQQKLQPVLKFQCVPSQSPGLNPAERLWGEVKKERPSQPDRFGELLSKQAGSRCALIIESCI